MILAPDTPSGCPIAIAPPFGLTLGSLSSRPKLLVTASACAANASFNSIISISSRERFSLLIASELLLPILSP